MDPLTIPRHGWVVVCDGVKALFLRNDGDAERPSLTVVTMANQPDPPTHELGSERPGRVFKSCSDARSSVEPVDLHNEAEVEFLTGVAKHLNRAVRDKEMRHVVLVAPPSALGVLRQHLSDDARAAVAREVDKDLTGHTVSDITRHLAA